MWLYFKNKNYILNKYAHLIWGTIMLIVVLVIGTIGYHIIEGWDYIDSFYMTWITLTTVGFGEVHPLSYNARFFTILIMLLGIGTFAYIIAMFSQILFDGRIKELLEQRSLAKFLKNLKKHYIICGYGRLGKIICKEFIADKIPFVIIEKESAKKDLIRSNAYHYIIGDATDEETLEAANINIAKGLISVVSSDADNVYIVLTAKGLNKDIFVLSRAVNWSSRKKLLQAGADKVVFPEHIGARRIAQHIMRPTVTDFLEMATFTGNSIDIMVEEFKIAHETPFCGKTLIESDIRKNLDLIIIAIKKKDGEMVFNPRSGTMIEDGDTLIAMGDKSNLIKFEKILSDSCLLINKVK